MAVGILLITHEGIGNALVAVATRLLRKLPLETEAFEVPFDGDLKVLGKDPRTQRDELMNDVCFIADVAVLPRWPSKVVHW